MHRKDSWIQESYLAFINQKGNEKYLWQIKLEMEK